MSCSNNNAVPKPSCSHDESRTNTTAQSSSGSIIINHDAHSSYGEEAEITGSYHQQDPSMIAIPQEQEQQHRDEPIMHPQEHNNLLISSSSQQDNDPFSTTTSKKPYGVVSFADEPLMSQHHDPVTEKQPATPSNNEATTTTTTGENLDSSPTIKPQERKRRISSRLPLTSMTSSSTTSMNEASTNGFDEEEESDDSSSCCSEDESQQDELSNQIQDNYFNARSRRVSLCAADILSVKKSEEQDGKTTPPTSSTSTARNNSILIVNEAINSYPSVNEIRSPREHSLDENSQTNTPKVYSSIIFEAKHDSKRIQQFEEITSNYHEYVTKNPKQFRKLIREGIPTKELMKTIWKRMVGSEELSNKYPGLYKKLTQLDETILEDDVHRIMKDVYRTYPQYEFFSEKDGPGQKALCRILKAYCYFDKQTGYCQGMAFICGFALMNLEDEEDTFWFFVQIMNNAKHGLKDIFCDGLPRLRMVMFMVSELVKLRLPDIHKHLEENYILPEMYASSILMTLCTNRFTFTASQRIWSIFLNEGWKIMVRLIVALLKLSRKELMGCNATEVTSKIYENAEQTDVETLLKYAFSVRLTSRLMTNLKAKYELVSLTEQEKQALRTQRENLRKIRSSSHIAGDSRTRSSSLQLPSMSSIFAKISNMFGLLDSREDDASLFKNNL
ncbi:hypothetical protein C9374_000018 [Naegleria lovaniensis]|uniref:Rab-GAP TBC domain-containing protein n=1 Tax=Naegleria lovaniensis TaxID=51637 RepID=A0AA88GZM1_NAELO|nr:uncharacterized protein C9374_000018 [Naegleria lovaniensis]KAG2388579.1 hypothetical protein C9374_000018 [Naegleria lovaniensis]